MAKSNNIVHQYFKKQFVDHKVLVKVDPIQFKGAEIMVPNVGESQQRKLDFDENILEDLAADGFVPASALEFNLFAAGLVV